MSNTIDTHWDEASPANSEYLSNIPGEIRILRAGVGYRIDKEHVACADSVGGEHKNGSAVAYQGATAITDRPDGSTALANNAYDRGRLWIDDNYDPPVVKRWDGTAWEVIGRYVADDTELKVYFENAEVAYTEGAKDITLAFRGYQASTSCDLANIIVSHEGTSDDQKGKMQVVMNDGDDDNTPSVIALEIKCDGTLSPSTSTCIIDEDDLTSDSENHIPTQQSVKAFVEGKFNSYAGGESYTFEGGLVLKGGVTTNGEGSGTVTFGDAFPNALVSIQCTLIRNGTDISDEEIQIQSSDTSGFTFNIIGNTESNIYWMAMGY